MIPAKEIINAIEPIIGTDSYVTLYWEPVKGSAIQIGGPKPDDQVKSVKLRDDGLIEVHDANSNRLFDPTGIFLVQQVEHKPDDTGMYA